MGRKYTLQPYSTVTYICDCESFRPLVLYDLVLTRFWLSENGPVQASYVDILSDLDACIIGLRSRNLHAIASYTDAYRRCRIHR